MDHPISGKLIVFEGIDGAGKTSIARRTAALLQEDGCDVLLTQEPGGTADGMSMRRLLEHTGIRENPEAEFLIFAADRALHMAQVVLPALQRGTIVISDRMGDSSYAYQGYGHGIDRAMITAINRWVMRSVTADLTVYVTIDYTTAQQRRQLRAGDDMSRYDQEKIQFFKRVVQGYEELYATRQGILRVDGQRTIETNAQDAYHAICALMGS